MNTATPIFVSAHHEARTRYPLFDSDRSNRVMFAAGATWALSLDSLEGIADLAQAEADARYPEYYTSDNSPFVRGVEWALTLSPQLT